MFTIRSSQETTRLALFETISPFNISIVCQKFKDLRTKCTSCKCNTALLPTFCRFLKSHASR